MAGCTAPVDPIAPEEAATWMTLPWETEVPGLTVLAEMNENGTVRVEMRGEPGTWGLLVFDFEDSGAKHVKYSALANSSGLAFLLQPEFVDDEMVAPNNPMAFENEVQIGNYTRSTTREDVRLILGAGANEAWSASFHVQSLAIPFSTGIGHAGTGAQVWKATKEVYGEWQFFSLSAQAAAGWHHFTLHPPGDFIWGTHPEVQSYQYQFANGEGIRSGTYALDNDVPTFAGRVSDVGMYFDSAGTLAADVQIHATEPDLDLYAISVDAEASQMPEHLHHDIYCYAFCFAPWGTVPAVIT